MYAGLEALTPHARAAYSERVRRYEDAVACREGDRIVIAPQVLYLPITLYGETTVQQVMEDYTCAYGSWVRYHREYQPDLAWGLQSIFSSAFLNELGCTYVKWPGKHFGNANAGFQAIDGEHMRQDEYLAYAEDPTGYMLRRLLPRHYEALRPLSCIDFSSILYLGAMYGMAPVGSNETMKALDALVRAGKKARTAADDAARLIQLLRNEGWPPASEFVANVPYDVFSDTMRGMLNT
ncbi:MAG: hypothetical protein Q4C13_02750, partial [Clostridia bacterium]|nr:hypothetical protein [Clostridia bacterium]